jgi:WD40 repeat protein
LNKKKECRLTINAHNENVSSIGWNSPNELVSCSWDQTIKLWNMDTVQSTQTFVSFCFNVYQRNKINLFFFRNVEKLFYHLIFHQLMVY